GDCPATGEAARANHHYAKRRGDGRDSEHCVLRGNARDHGASEDSCARQSPDRSRPHHFRCDRHQAYASKKSRSLRRRHETMLTALARHPDCALALLDLTLPGARGLDLLAELRRDYPWLPILVLSATHDRATVGAALAAGARGYVSKTASSDALLDAIRTVLG